MQDAARVVGWINAQCAREALAPDGLGAVVWAAVDSGEITADEAPLLVRSMLTAGLDTTIIGLGNALFALASNPDEWRRLRDNPALVRPAFDEMLRFESPVQTFFEPPRARPNSAASRCRRTPRSCCSSPAPIAIRAAGTTRNAST